MEPKEYLQLLRRRAALIVAAALAGLVFGWFTLPAAKTQRDDGGKWVATHTLIADYTDGRTGLRNINFDRYALYVTTGDVPRRVAEALGINPRKEVAEGTPSKRVRKQGAVDNQRVVVGGVTVAAAPDPATGSLVITARGGDRRQVAKVADLFAAELKAYLDETGLAQFQQSADVLNEKIAALDQQVRDLDLRLFAAQQANDPNTGSIEAQRNAAVRRLSALQEQLGELQQQGAATSGLRTLEAAVARRVAPDSGLSAPQGTLPRLMLATVLGLLVGVGIALVLERFDSRLRDVHVVEAVAKMPILAEVPPVQMRGERRYVVVAADEPSTLAAESYRTLRTSLGVMWQARHELDTGGNGDRPAANGDAPPHPQVVLVTSPGPSEGKSVTAANLAAVYAETGLSVIAVDADFRRPSLHRYLKVGDVPTLWDLDRDARDRAALEAVLHDTYMEGVRIAASSPAGSNPAVALAKAKRAVELARGIADVVVIDSPPLLFANDAPELSGVADTIVLVARAGRTRKEALERGSLVLARLEAPALGIAFIASAQAVRASGGYGYGSAYGYGYGYGYGHPGRRQGWRPWRRRPRRGEQGRRGRGAAVGGRSRPSGSSPVAEG